MAQHQRIQRSGVDAKDFRIVGNRQWRVAEIDQHLPCHVAGTGFDVHR
jgi:hypothetical protein